MIANFVRLCKTRLWKVRDNLLNIKPANCPLFSFLEKVLHLSSFCTINLKWGVVSPAGHWNCGTIVHICIKQVWKSQSVLIKYTHCTWTVLIKIVWSCLMRLQLVFQLVIVTVRNKVAARLCFQKRLWFCWCLADTTLGRHPLLGRHPPSWQTVPPPQTPRADTPQTDTPRQKAPKADPTPRRWLLECFLVFIDFNMMLQCQGQWDVKMMQWN